MERIDCVLFSCVFIVFRVSLMCQLYFLVVLCVWLCVFVNGGRSLSSIDLFKLICVGY